MMNGCNNCVKWCGISALVLGILFLLVDLGVWTFYNIQWWTAVLVVFGVGGIGSAGCKACQALRKK